MPSLTNRKSPNNNEAIETLRLQIELNKMLPADMRCNAAIHKWEAQLARLKGRPFTVVVNDD